MRQVCFPSSLFLFSFSFFARGTTVLRTPILLYLGGWRGTSFYPPRCRVIGWKREFRGEFQKMLKGNWYTPRTSFQLLAKQARMERYLSSAFPWDKVSKEQRAISLFWCCRQDNVLRWGQPTSSELAGQRIQGADVSRARETPSSSRLPGVRTAEGVHWGPTSYRRSYKWPAKMQVNPHR